MTDQRPEDPAPEEPASGETPADPPTDVPRPPEGTEPTVPLGTEPTIAYGQPQQPPQPPQTGPVFNPTSAQGYGEGSYPAPTPHDPYRQDAPPPGQQPPGGYPPPGYQPGYGPPPGYQSAYGQAAYSPPLPEHPQATTALVLGLVGAVGGWACCGLPFLVSPFAWYLGARAEREIIAEPTRYGGLSNAKAAKILGMIGTVFLALALLVGIGLVAAGFAGVWDTDSSDFTYEEPY